MMSAPGFRLVKSAPESSSMPQVTIAVPTSTLRSGGAAQQGGVGKRHDHDRQALQKAGSGGRGEAGAQAHAGELGCHNGADDSGANHKVARLIRKARLWKSSRQATKAMMQRSATMLVAFMLSMPIFMRGTKSPMQRGTENESAIAFFAIHGAPFCYRTVS